MKRPVELPYYLKIARDIATRVAKGEFEEGQRIYGRSVMASEYNSSPETVRRALKLLSDMKVIEVKPQSGATVLSKDNAARYIKNFEESANVRNLLLKLQNLEKQYSDINEELFATVEAIVQTRYSFVSEDDPLPNYELRIPDGSWLIGKSIGSLKFWQSTGSTIIAIRRRQNVILSPGPYAELFNGDTIVFVGTPAAAEAVNKFVFEGGGTA